MSEDAQIILASASPRRRELLEQLGVRVVVQPVDIDESQKEGELALAYVQRLAITKANVGFDIMGKQNQLPVLGSDTIVEVDGIVLGKPENRTHAKGMLQQLSGKKHTVHTSVAIVACEERYAATNSTDVEFKVLDEQEIDDYLATNEADDKAGSYAIQGVAAQFISCITGSFSGVMGLPLYETAQLLQQCEIKTIN